LHDKRLQPGIFLKQGRHCGIRVSIQFGILGGADR